MIIEAIPDAPMRKLAERNLFLIEEDVLAGNATAAAIAGFELGVTLAAVLTNVEWGGFVDTGKRVHEDRRAGGRARAQVARKESRALEWLSAVDARRDGQTKEQVYAHLDRVHGLSRGTVKKAVLRARRWPAGPDAQGEATRAAEKELRESGRFRSGLVGST